MARARKYRKGPRFETLAELVTAIERGEYVYLNQKVTHPGWAVSMQLHALRRIVYGYHRTVPAEDRGAFRALPNEPTES